MMQMFFNLVTQVQVKKLDFHDWDNKILLNSKEQRNAKQMQDVNKTLARWSKNQMK